VLPMEPSREESGVRDAAAPFWDDCFPDLPPYKPEPTCLNSVGGLKKMLYPERVLIDELSFSTSPYPTRMIERLSGELGRHQVIGDTLVWWADARLASVPETFTLTMRIWGSPGDSLEHVVFVSAADARGNNLLDTTLGSRKIIQNYLQTIVFEEMGPLENCHAVVRMVIYDISTNTLLEGARVYFRDEEGNILDSAISSGKGVWNVEQKVFIGGGSVVVDAPGYRVPVDETWDGSYHLRLNDSPYEFDYPIEPVLTRAPKRRTDTSMDRSAPIMD
jgi:hypothetical protein